MGFIKKIQNKIEARRTSSLERMKKKEDYLKQRDEIKLARLQRQAEKAKVQKQIAKTKPAGRSLQGVGKFVGRVGQNAANMAGNQPKQKTKVVYRPMKKKRKQKMQRVVYQEKRQKSPWEI